MKVVEQLIQHFHHRGALTHTEIEYLIRHGYIRRHDLHTFGPPDAPDDEPAEPTPLYDEHADRREEETHRKAEETEEELSGRRAGKKKGGKGKVKPAGHDLVPLATVLGSHLADREAYPALLELGNRLTKCPDWQTAANAIASARVSELEPHLVSQLNHRPPAFGELWFWCEIDSLFAWAEHKDNAGPVASALASLMQADVPTQVGRIHQLKKVPEVDGLMAVLAMRRTLLNCLRGLYDRHFARLKVWLVPPTGPAADVWPALPWAFVLYHNAQPADAVGYPVRIDAIPEHLRPTCWETLCRMDFTAMMRLIERNTPAYRAAPDAAVAGADDGWRFVSDRDYACPFDWRL